MNAQLKDQTTCYICQSCGWVMPIRPDSPIQICSHCPVEYDARDDESTIRWAEIVVSMLIGLMMGVIVTKSFL